MYPVVPFQFDVEKQQRPTRPQDPIVLVLSPPLRTVLSETVLVLDGCSNCTDADRRSKRFAGTRGPIGRIAILD